jgi:hypothetical protein
MEMSETKTLTFKDKFQAAKTAYLSIPAKLKDGGEEKIIAQVRSYWPHLRIGAYRAEFDGGKDWKENFGDFIAGVDALIVACDSSRLIGPGVLREIQFAWKAQKLIILFKVDDNQYRMYCGFEKEGKTIRLRKREERFKGRAHLEKGLGN